MNKISWRVIAELVAVISVVLSLVFVGLEIRQNSRIASAAEYREILNRLDVQRTALAVDPKLAEIYRTYQDLTTDSLTETEFQQLVFIVSSTFSTYEIAFFSRQYGVVGDAEWLRFASGACTHFERANSMGFIPSFLSLEFRNFLESNC